MRYPVKGYGKVSPGAIPQIVTFGKEIVLTDVDPQEKYPLSLLVLRDMYGNISAPSSANWNVLISRSLHFSSRQWSFMWIPLMWSASDVMSFEGDLHSLCCEIRQNFIRSKNNTFFRSQLSPIHQLLFTKRIGEFSTVSMSAKGLISMLEDKG